jgi:penicillin-binding protein 1C
MQRVSVGTAGQGSGVPAIASPADGTIFALDPDIPPAAQRVWFQADGLTGQTAHAVTWRMDGKQLGKGGQVAWLPWPGRHRVQLVDAAGKVVHEIGIEVRGAGVRAVGSQKASLRR